MENNKILSKPIVVFFLASLCCFLWGSATPAIKTGYRLFSIDSSDTVSIILFAGIRFFIAGLLVVCIESIAGKRFIMPSKGSLPCIAKLALVQTVIQYVCFYVGLAHTSGVVGTILSGANGFMSIFIAAIIFKLEPLTKRKIAGCLMGLAGLIAMNISFSGRNELHFSFLGEGLVLASALALAFSGIMVKRYSSRFDVVMLSGYQFLLGGFAMIIIGLIFGGRIAFADDPSAYILVLYMGMLSAVAYSLWSVLMSKNDVSSVTIYSFMTPVCGVLLSAIFLGEVEEALQINKLAALLLICLGIYIVNRKPQKN